MTCTIGRPLGREPAPDYHIERLGGENLDHLRSDRRLVGVIAIDEHVDIGIDVAEHPPDDVTLALHGLVADDRACGLGARRRVIAGVIVVNVDGRCRQCGAKVTDDMRNGHLLIEARNEHGDSHEHSMYEIGRTRGITRVAANVSPHDGVRLSPRFSRAVSTGATCLAPYMKRMTGPKTGALAAPTMNKPGTEVSKRESSAGMPAASRAMVRDREGSR